jgi:hypothetical protein
MGEACSTRGNVSVHRNFLSGNLKGRKPLRRPRLKWEGNTGILPIKTVPE